MEQTEYFLCCINPGEKDTFHLFNDFDAIIGSVDNNLIPLDFVAEYNVRLAKTGARFLDEKAHKCFEIWFATDIFMREEIKSLTNTRRCRYIFGEIFAGDFSYHDCNGYCFLVAFLVVGIVFPTMERPRS